MSDETQRSRARWLPQTIRARLTLQYAAIFLAAGAVLLGVTYGLVAHSLPVKPSAAASASQQAKLNAACKAAALHKSAAVPGGKPVPRTVPIECQEAFSAGAKAAANDQRAQTLHNLLWYSLLGLGVMTVASGAVGWLVAGRALRPVRIITSTARRASEAHLGERVALDGPDDELKQLADTFDDMLDRLDAAFTAQRRFVANASHELRTPLTVMRTAIEVTLAKSEPTQEQLEVMAHKVRRSVDQADRLIDALLTLAVSEHNGAAPERVDLATLSEDALDAAAPAIDALGLHLETELEPAATEGDAVLLERLAGNLIENAVHHNAPGGTVRVVTRTTPQGASLCVTNDGPVVAEDLVAELFEPFRRVDERTNPSEGVGLGLAIVKSVCAAHGGNIDARSRVGGGLEVLVTLPNEAPA